MNRAPPCKLELCFGPTRLDGRSVPERVQIIRISQEEQEKQQQEHARLQAEEMDRLKQQLELRMHSPQRTEKRSVGQD